MCAQMEPNEKLVEDLMRNIGRQQKNSFIKSKWILGLAACLGVVAAAFLWLPAMLYGHSFQTASMPESVTPDTQRIPSWEERSLPSKFDRLLVDGNLFIATERTVDETKIGSFLFHTTMTGYDYTDIHYYVDIEKATPYKIDAEVYALQSVSRECMVAVKYDGQDAYYSFTWNSYIPDTLGGFMDRLNLREYLVIETLHYEGEPETAYTLPDDDLIWKFLQENSGAPYVNPTAAGRIGGELGIKVSMDILPQDAETFIGLSRSGYLFTNLFGGKLWAFQLGEEETGAFMDDALENSIPTPGT